MRVSPGSLVDVTWADITEDSTGEPDKITPAVMTHTWRFYCWKTFALPRARLKCGVFSSGQPDKDGNYNHAIVIPRAVILSIKPAKRK